jgi:hypothetical protein
MELNTVTQPVTPVKTEQGWVITMPAEMAQDAGVPEGSIVVLYPINGSISTEIIPPASPELERKVEDIADKFHEAFVEMKRLGD